MVENKKEDESSGSGCPIHNEWLRHGLYLGAMVAMHAGLGATAWTSQKSSKCPLSETARHLVYLGGFVALAVKAGMATNEGHLIKDKETGTPKESSCPVNELKRHAVYIAGMIGLVALVNSRKK
mmetsp:Transcript_1096/g.1961  ORF Transcript_1096/g.1961 Transcript_1096/m.1961 type:complete len:124 (+) Transcript_1096:148-519(+)